jgi:hypothetical protein
MTYCGKRKYWNVVAFRNREAKARRKRVVLNALRAAVRVASSVGFSLVDALRASAVAEIDLKRTAALEQDAYDRGYRKGCEEGAAPAVPRPWPQFADRCLTHHARLLNEFERKFCASVIERGLLRPSPKQFAVLQRLSLKCGVRMP